MDGEHVFLEFPEAVGGVGVVCAIDPAIVDPPADLEANCGDKVGKHGGEKEADPFAAEHFLGDVAKADAYQVGPTGEKKDAHELAAEDFREVFGKDVSGEEVLSLFEGGAGDDEVFFKPFDVIARIEEVENDFPERPRVMVVGQFFFRVAEELVERRSGERCGHGRRLTFEDTLSARFGFDGPLRGFPQTGTLRCSFEGERGLDLTNL